jgi:hypothetical protein
MFTRILTAAAVLGLAAGCAKKTAKNTGRADDTAGPPPVEKLTVGKPKDGGAADLAKKDEKPTWLRPQPQDGVLPVDAPGTGRQPWVANPPPGTAPVPPPAGNAGGPGAVVSPPNTPVPPPGGVVRPPMGMPLPPFGPQTSPPPVGPTGTPTGPAGKVVTKADMTEVWIFIENYSLAKGKMPPPEWTLAALIEAKSPAADLVRGGYILLTGKSSRESVWAFERNAPAQGGWVAGHNGPEQLTAAEFARRIRE